MPRTRFSLIFLTLFLVSSFSFLISNGSLGISPVYAETTTTKYAVTVLWDFDNNTLQGWTGHSFVNSNTMYQGTYSIKDNGAHTIGIGSQPAIWLSFALGSGFPRIDYAFPANILNANLTYYRGSFWNNFASNTITTGIQIRYTNGTIIYSDVNTGGATQYNTWVQTEVWDIDTYVDSDMGQTLRLILGVCGDDNTVHWTTGDVLYYDSVTLKYDYEVTTTIPVSNFYEDTIFQTTTTEYTALKNYTFKYVLLSGSNSTGNYTSGMTTSSTSNIIFYTNTTARTIDYMRFYGYFSSKPLPVHSTLTPVKLTLKGMFNSSGYLENGDALYQLSQLGTTADRAYDSNSYNWFTGNATSATGFFIGQFKNSTSEYLIDRLFLVFDTSSIFEGVTILNVTLGITAFYAQGSDYLVVSNASSVDTPPDFSDYNKIYYATQEADWFGSIQKDLIDDGLPTVDYDYTNITLTTDSVHFEGLTKYVLRTSNEIAGIPPTEDISEIVNIQAIGFGATVEPFLEIWYRGESQIDVSTTGYAVVGIDKPAIFINDNFAGYQTASVQVPNGTYKVSFSNYFNYITPKSTSFVIALNEKVSVNGVYVTPPVIPPPTAPISFFGLSIFQIISGGFITAFLGFIFGLIADMLHHSGIGLAFGVLVGEYVCNMAGILPSYIFIGTAVLIVGFGYLHYHHSNGGGMDG